MERRTTIIGTTVIAVAGVLFLVILFTSGHESYEDVSSQTAVQPTVRAADSAAESPVASDGYVLPDWWHADSSLPEAPQRSWRCSPEDLPQFQALSPETFPEMIADTAAFLSRSDNAELVLAAAWLDDIRPAGSADAFAEKVVELDADHPLVLWQAADWCTRSRKLAFCADADYLERVSKANSNNGAYWAMVASEQLRDGDDRQALVSLERAATAAIVDFRFVEQTLLLERGLAAAGGLGVGQRILIAMATAPLPGEQSDLYTACRERAATDALWANACLDYGRRLAAESDTLVYRMIGYRMQRQIYEHAGQMTEVERVVAITEELIDDLAGLGDDVILLVLADQRFAAAYFDQLATHGEIAATQFVAGEVARLKADPGYDPCTLAGIAEDSR